MPCRGYDADDYSRDANEATRAACDIARVIRKEHPEAWKKMQGSLKKKTLAWIEEHDAEDRERAQEERVEKNRRSLASKAKAKLTKAERDALGCNP